MFNDDRRKAFYLLIIIVFIYYIYNIYISYLCLPSNLYIYDDSSIEIKYILKVIYITLNYSLFHLIIYIYNPVEYRKDERLLNIIIYSYFIISEIGIIFNALKNFIY